jgi:hypothetical protein
VDQHGHQLYDASTMDSLGCPHRAVGALPVQLVPALVIFRPQRLDGPLERGGLLVVDEVKLEAKVHEVLEDGVEVGLRVQFLNLVEGTVEDDGEDAKHALEDVADV